MVDTPAPTRYFAYGSNLWLDQMKHRCPKSPFVGVAMLPDYKWYINNRGYANVKPSKGDVVWGMMYDLHPDDERVLDQYEEVPDVYLKRTVPVNFTREEEDGTRKEAGWVDALAYVDVTYVAVDSPMSEYISRMNQGVADSLRKGIPADYFEKYIRPFIPAENPSGEAAQLWTSEDAPWL